MCRCFTYTYVCGQAPGTEVTDGYVLPCTFRASNQSPLEELALFTAELSPHAHFQRSLKCICLRQKAKASLYLP